MGYRSDGLIVSKARKRAAIHNLEDASLGSGCGIRSLIENASHVPVAFWRAVAVVYACGLVVARAGTDPRGETFLGRKCSSGRADFCNDLLRAPECAQMVNGNLVPQPPSADNIFIPAGGSARNTLNQGEVARFQCCIHPWMRLTITPKDEHHEEVR
jgi:hypothetical protein